MSKIDVSQVSGIIGVGLSSGFSGPSGISADDHKTLRQLIHFIDEGPAEGFASGAYKEITPIGSPFPTSVIWYSDSTKAKKIVEKSIVRNSKKIPTSIIWKVYNIDGVSVVNTVQDNISYVNNIFEVSRLRTVT